MTFVFYKVFYVYTAHVTGFTPMNIENKKLFHKYAICLTSVHLNGNFMSCQLSHKLSLIIKIKN